MNTMLQPQLKNSEEIKRVLKKVNVSFNLADGRSVSTLLVYLPCIENGKSDHAEFFNCIKQGILQNFVLSCSEVEKKTRIKSNVSSEEMFQKALRKISKHTAKGELGELILFTLLDVYLSAPKLLSKVSMKTNPRMPVFGADAVHAQFVDGELRVYLGESKLYKSFKSAASEATDSMRKAKNKFDDEFDLIDSYMDFPNLDDALEEKILQLLNPFNNEQVLERIHSPCFIGFTQPDIISKDETSYLEKYKKLACEYVGDFYSKVEQQDLTINEVTLLMLPFSCVDELVNEFITYIGVYK